MADFRTMQRRARIKEICAPYVYPWLRSLGEAVKREGAYPISLCDYYPSPQDKEVAGVVELLAPTKRREQYIFVLHGILGDNPSAMVAERNFMHLNDSRKLLNNTGLGVSKSDILNILDWVWSVRHKRGLPLEQAVLGEMGLIKKSHAEDLLVLIPGTHAKYRLTMLLAKMGMRDGYGAGLWEYIKESELPLYLTRGIRDFVSRYYLDNRDIKTWGVANVAKFMGFDVPVELLYAYWGYEHARAVIPDELNALEKKIEKWYNSLRVRTALKCDLPTDELFE